jgi:Mrp family chromosome partitioning ATPase
VYGDTVDQNFEPTVVGAAWRYRWLVVFVAVGFAGLGWLYGTRSEAWSATASVTVQDPRAANLFDQTAAVSPDRFVTDQVEIIRSRAAASLAAERLAAEDPPILVEASDIASNLAVIATDRSNVILVTFTGRSPIEAIAVVNAIVDTYQTVRREAVQSSYAVVLARLDESIEEIESELAGISAELTSLRGADDPRTAAIKEEMDAALDRLLAAPAPPSNAPADDVALSASRLSELRLRLETMRLALDVNVDPDDLAAVFARQDEARRRFGELQTRRVQLAVDAELTGSGIVFFDPAVTASPSGVGVWLVLGGMAGALIGITIAFLLARGRQRFTGRTDPSTVLAARLLADVPDFLEERLVTLLPVVEAPESASAEAFRFVATAIVVQQADRGADRSGPAFHTVAFTSASVADGKTLVAANTAIAAAREGSRVLAIDADFGNQSLTDVLGATPHVKAGLTEAVRSQKALADAVVHLTFSAGGSIHLLSRGFGDIRPPDFFNSPEVADMFGELGHQYDLVIVDTPPLLRVAYSTAIIRRVDRAVVVIPHGSDIALAAEMREQLEVTGTPILGYVYNKAPLRQEMTLSAGSMADRLGDRYQALDADAEGEDWHSRAP